MTFVISADALAHAGVDGATALVGTGLGAFLLGGLLLLLGRRRRNAAQN